MPQIVSEHYSLEPDGRRGPAASPIALSAAGDSIVLDAPLTGVQRFPFYRLELVDVDAKRTVWNRPGLQPKNDESFSIVVPRGLLRATRYRLALYGGDGTHEQPMATYTFRFE